MSAMPFSDSPSPIGEELYGLVGELFPINRSLTGPGFRETLDTLERHGGVMTRHSWPSGFEAFDWVAPDEWTLREAWIRDPAGRTIVDAAACNLHVVGYSEPVHAHLELEELQQHLYSLTDQPEAVPYLTSYYERRWGFCLSDEQRQSLKAGTYEVMIDADLKPGTVVLGEIVVPGTSDREVLISTYCCHPSMANNELSGPVIAALLARELRQRPSLRFTYRFLFVPETIGSILYLHAFGDELKRALAAGWVLTCAGDDGPFTFKRSRRGDSLADRVAEHVLRYSGHEYRLVDFFPSGSDERQYCSPGFDLPVGSLMRTMYGAYPEYHTSLDDMSFVSAKALGETYAMYLQMIDALEANEVFTVALPYCEPQLGKRGLYPTLGSQKETELAVMDMMWLLNMCDGSRDLVAVADRAGRPVAALAEVAAKLESSGLLVRTRPAG